MTQRQHFTALIVGGGQAGLSASYYLCRDGIDHLVLERDTKFHSWRENRWDSFCLVTPNWQCRLPDFPYADDDPHGFMLRDEIVRYVDAFADSFDPPLREGVTVTRVARTGAHYEVDTTDDAYTADHVIIASGGYDTPITPPYAQDLDPGIFQMQSRAYRRPEQIPEGTCLVVGTGQSGVQLMEDLHLAGRSVALAVGPAPRSPRMYRGRDATDWLYDLGHYDVTIDRHPDPAAAVAKTNHYMSGRDGGHEIDLRKFALEGVQLFGSVAAMEGDRIGFLPDLEKNLDDADRSYVGIRDTIDAHIAQNGIDAPEAAPFEKVWRPEREVTGISAAEAGITSVLWCIGFRPDYSWLHADCLDTRGRPVHSRGVCDLPGMYFLGLGWLNTWGSGRFLGVGEDALHVAQTITERLRKSARTGTDG